MYDANIIASGCGYHRSREMIDHLRDLVLPALRAVVWTIQLDLHTMIRFLSHNNRWTVYPECTKHEVSRHTSIEIID